MAYRLTKHADVARTEREIKLEWLEEVLARPQRVEADRVDSNLEHRLGKIAAHEDRVLRVIVDVTKEPNVVVTVFFDRGMRGKL